MRGRNNTGRIPVGQTQFAIGTVARHMRRRVDSDAGMAYEQPQEDREANVSGGKSHVRYDRVRLWLFRK